jgi:predicted permease
MERELDQEVAFHIGMETEKLVGQGMSSEAAAREARLRFGAMGRERETIRDAWAVGWVRDFRVDLLHTFRQFARRPLYTGLGVATLAVGIGATVALFSVVQGLLLRPLPVRDEAALHVFWSDYNWRGVEFDFVKERIPAFSGLAAYSTNLIPLRTETATSTVLTVVSSAELFDVLGAAPLQGRTFRTGEDRVGAEPVIVVSWAMWQQELGADPNVIGRRIVFGGESVTVIGVMPRGFYFPTPEYRAWQPLRLDPASGEYQGNGWLVLVGRTKPGTTEPQLVANIQSIATALGERFTYPAAWDKTKGATTTPLRRYLLGDLKPALLLLLGAVTLLLAMACANVAALILARTTDRAPELVLRTALGAGRGRLARQVVTESIVLSGVAGLLGAGLAAAIFRVLVASLPLNGGFGEAVSLDWTSFAAAVLVAVLVGLAVAAAPVRDLLLGRLGGVTGERGADGLRGGTGRVHGWLVGGEVALAVLLSAGASLFIKSVSRLYSVDTGFDPRGVLVADLVTSPNEMPAPARLQFFRSMVERATALPEVAAAGLIGRLPIRDAGWQGTVEIEGRPDLAGANGPNSLFRPVTPGYFAAMDVAIRSGRPFDGSDRLGGLPVALVSEGFAKRAWPGLDPIGRRVRTGIVGDTSWITVVGVAEETRMVRMTGENPITLYVPLEQLSFALDGIAMVVKARGDPTMVLPVVRRLASELDRRVAVARSTTMDEVVSSALSEPLRLRFFLSLFAGLALVLGTVGVYGVASYSVARRRAEFGIRTALGAAPTRVLREVVGRGMIPVLVGVVIGLVAAVSLSRVVGRLLYGVAPTDGPSLAAAGATLLLAGIAASFFPALRASRVSPVEALRAE